MAASQPGPRYTGWWKDSVNNRLSFYNNGTRIGAINTRGITLGAHSAFATTEPTSAIIFKSGTAFAGAITTSGGLQSSDTVVTKVIAAGTVSNVEA